MKPLVATLVALSLFALPTVSLTASPKLFDSVKALAIPTATVKAIYDANGKLKQMQVVPDLTNICTVSSINHKQRLWLTAYHCVSDQSLKYFISGEQAILIMGDEANDLAILQTLTVVAPALKLSKKAPKVEDRVKMAGHPFGWIMPTLSVGMVMSVSNQFETEGPYARPFMILAVDGAPGNSGSAVVNSKDEIISVCQIAWSRTFAGVMGGVTFDSLVKYRSYWN